MATRLGNILKLLPDKYDDKKVIIEKPTNLCNFVWENFSKYLLQRPNMVFKTIWLQSFKSHSQFIMNVLLEKTSKLHLVDCNMKCETYDNKEIIIKKFAIETLSMVDSDFIQAAI